MYVNKTILDIFQFSDEVDILGRPVEALMSERPGVYHQGYIDVHLGGEASPVMNKLRRIRAKRADGKVFPVDIHVIPVELDDEPYFVGFIRDMSELQTKEEELHRLLHYDSLTGLANAKSLELHLQEENR